MVISPNERLPAAMTAPHPDLCHCNITQPNILGMLSNHDTPGGRAFKRAFFLFRGRREVIYGPVKINTTSRFLNLKC